MVHIQTFGYIPSLLFYLGRYFFSTLGRQSGTLYISYLTMADNTDDEK